MSDLREGSFEDWFVVDGCWGYSEGSAEDLENVIENMDKRESGSVNSRLGVTCTKEGFELYSPRNQGSDTDVCLISKASYEDWRKKSLELIKR